jgi:hypothetical protein
MNAAQKKRVSACEGKTKFETFARARRTASRQAHKHAERFSPYACSHCGAFHVGTSVSGGTPSDKMSDVRQRYVVFAAGPDGKETKVGYCNHADGSGLARYLGAGWRVTRVLPKRT